MMHVCNSLYGISLSPTRYINCSINVAIIQSAVSNNIEQLGPVIYCYKYTNNILIYYIFEMFMLSTATHYFH